MVDVSSIQKTTALFLSTIVTDTKDTENGQKSDKPVLCNRTSSLVLRAVFLHS